MTPQPRPAGPLRRLGQNPAAAPAAAHRHPGPRRVLPRLHRAGSPTPTTWSSPSSPSALDDPAAIPSTTPRLGTARAGTPGGRGRQPLARIARLYWPDPRVYLRDPEGFRQMLRPACRRCTARCGITGPVACHLPPHRTVCRRHRLWTGPSARSHAGQLDVSPFPEILRAQRRHLAQLHHHRGRKSRPPSATPPTPSTAPCAPAPGSPASSGACASSPPAPGLRPCAGVPGWQTTAPATPPSRSRSTPTSSGSPRTYSGRRAPATTPRRNAPASGRAPNPRP